jgi:aminomethyltransferase
MLSYHADVDINTNPFELGLDRLVALDEAHDFVGKSALLAIRERGVSRKQAGLILHGAPLTAPNTTFWPVLKDGKAIGKITSAVYSPRLEQNIALAMINSQDYALGAQFDVEAAQGLCKADLVEMPFYDPKKNIAKG